MPESRKQRRKQERNRKRPRTDELPASSLSFAGPKRSHRSKDRVLLTTTHTTKAEATGKKTKQSDDPYSHLDPVVAAALRRDDLEIERLESQLGQNKDRLNREYATKEGFGADFGDFLDDLDVMVKRVTTTSGVVEGEYRSVLHPGEESLDDDDDDSSEMSIPMKRPAQVRPSYDSSDDSDSSSVSNEDKSSEFSGDDEQEVLERASLDNGDDGESVMYRPVRGEDIYGKCADNKADSTDKPKKYLPPHLRNIDPDKQAQTLRDIQRALNSSLNRLSEDTLVSVAQELVKVYDGFSTTDVNHSLFNNLQAACVSRGQTMDGLIPIYVAAIAGVHFCKGDLVQLGEYMMEKTTTSLLQELKKEQQEPNNEEGEAPMNRETSNLALILCYFYNFGLVHCTLLYDIVRHCLEGFREVDVEVLLLLLRHCGRALRSDDPLALKEIVLLVQKKQAEQQEESSSRADYMVQTILDLKNNKRRKQDEVIVERTTKLRKMLGHIKSNADRRPAEPLRISLNDILSIDEKGRWWKVGASWAGNADTTEQSVPAQNSEATSDMDPKLLKLAARYRMNTDIRRAIFCIIMGSEDYEDCFEKLVRAGMLKQRVERDTVRVLMECCGREKSFNKFYSHLASRLCEYQPQAKFSFQLAFWDNFKQFEEIAARKAANHAKLLFHLVAVNDCLKLSVIKPLEMAVPGDLAESAMIFLTVFLSNVLEHFDDPSQVKNLIHNATPSKKKKELDLEEPDGLDDNAALRASLTVFLVQVMKSSPKYKKGSKFRGNLKAAIKACDLDDA